MTSAAAAVWDVATRDKSRRRGGRRRGKALLAEFLPNLRRRSPVSSNSSPRRCLPFAAIFAEIQMGFYFSMSEVIRFLSTSDFYLIGLRGFRLGLGPNRPRPRRRVFHGTPITKFRDNARWRRQNDLRRATKFGFIVIHNLNSYVQASVVFGRSLSLSSRSWSQKNSENP